ncbi:MAG: TfoX/Sxy family protein [Hyphomicrobiales bacterium]
MATDKSTIDYILEQAAGAGYLSARKMFGEYALYCNGKTVALVCDDQLFVRQTPEGRAHVGEVIEGLPYRGAKPWLLIRGDRWEDADWLADLLRITGSVLPEPKPKTPRKASTLKKNLDAARTRKPKGAP